MKKWIFAAALILGFNATYACEEHDTYDKNNPCTPVAQACEKAGYKKMDKDKPMGACLKPIIDGVPLADVDIKTISPEQMKACKAYKEKHKDEWKKNKKKRKKMREEKREKMEQKSQDLTPSNG